jgi:maltose/maltodextrin transport system substrate-binding protein
MSALVIGMIHYAEWFPDEPDRDQATEIAFMVADFLLSMIEPPGSPLEHWPPTYWDGVPRENHPYYHNEIMTNTPAIGAEMLLDLYDFTRDKTYFRAARRIADTYVNTQESSGTWPQLLHTETGEAVKPHKLVPTMVIELYDRFLEQYQVTDYEASRQKAFDWIMRNPMQTYNWQAQFEDTRPQSRFKNMSREEPSEYARILLKASDEHPRYIDLATELIRFAEDQFIVWEASDPVLSHPWFSPDSRWNGTTRPGGPDWFLPCALEQYKFYTPIARSSQLMILTYLDAWRVTGDTVYRAKAVALANALTRAQAYHGGGMIPTHLRKHLPEANWINNGVYPAITLIEHAEDLSRPVE